jgi:hypothetical protein
MADARLSHLLHVWCRRRGNGRMPSRADIDPVDIGAAVLPHIALTEVVHDHGRMRFRFRLSGTALNEGAGLELTGQYIDAVNPNSTYSAYIEGLYRKVMEVRCPLFSSSTYVGTRLRARRLTRRMMCPLSDDGETVNMFITAQSFDVIGSGALPSMTFAQEFTQGALEVVDCAAI